MILGSRSWSARGSAGAARGVAERVPERWGEATGYRATEDEAEAHKTSEVTAAPFFD